MAKNSLKIALFLLFFTLTKETQGQPKNESQLSLRNCIQMSLNNNIKLRQVQLETEKSRYQLKEAISAGLPQISGFASFEDYFNIPVTMVSGEILGQPGTMVPIQLGTKFNSNAGIQAGQMIYNANYFASVQLFKKSCEISDLNFQKNKEELAYNVARIYLFIQITNKQLALLDSNLLAFNKIYGYSEEHYKNGFIRKAELDRVKVAINNQETDRYNLQLARDQQLNMMKYLIGMDLDHSPDLSDVFETTTTPFIYTDSTFDQQIDVKILNQQKELAILNSKLSKSEYLPSLSGYAGYSFQAQTEKFASLDESNNWYKTSFAGIKLAVPLFEGNRVRSRVSQNKIQLEQINLGIKDLHNELAANYENALQKLNVSITLENQQKANMEISENVLDTTKELYRQGLKSFTDVLNVQAEYNGSHLSWLNAVLQIKLSELEILKITGKLNSLLN